MLLSAIFSLQFTKNCLAAGLRQDPLGELERSPRPLAAIAGLLLRGGGKVRGRKGQERMRKEERDGEWEGKEGRRGKGGEGVGRKDPL